MVEIQLRNSRTRKVERLEPLDPAQGVRLYLCGPTVYDRAHLGNARNVIMFDVLFRLLSHVSPMNGWGAPTYVRNFTDVDDKINAKAAETGRPISEITEETIGWYHADMDALGNLRPTHEPRATAYIAEMIAMIETLVAEGHAYAAEGHVLFAVDSWRDHYGQLSGRSVDDMIAGARVEVAPYKRNPMDFVLWKPSTPDLPGWDSPWGRGRPGWHIECSAMAKALLGETFDIHGGGNDLMFPHHENEIAQSCCANGTERMAQIWLHNEMLQVEGKKMSKSLGNFFTVRDLLDQYDSEFGINNIGPAIRLRLIEGHYRSPLDADRTYVEAAATKLGTWAFWLKDFDLELSGQDKKEILESSPALEALRDDLNTPKALSIVEGLIDKLRAIPSNNSTINDFADTQENAAKHAMAILDLLGFELEEMWALHHSQWSNVLASRRLKSDRKTIDLIERLISERANARKSKDFARADKIRDAFLAAGLVVNDNPDGTSWEITPHFDPAKLENLL